MTNTAFGCCGSDRELRGLLAAADMHPRTTKAGQRARARLALALVERRALAAGDRVFAGRARRSLESLGTTEADIRRALQERSRSLYEAREARLVADVDRVFAVARTVADAINGIIAAVAAANPTDTGLQDATKVTAWVNWVLGGALPLQVDAADVRIMHTIFAVGTPLLQATLSGAVFSLDPQGTNTGLRSAVTWISNTWLRGLKETIDAAYAALPPPSTTPATDTSTGRFSTSTLNTMRTVTSSGVRYRCGDGSLVSDPRTCPGMVWCSDGTLAPSAAACPPPVTTEKSSGVLLVLPAALLAWYLIK